MRKLNINNRVFILSLSLFFTINLVAQNAPKTILIEQFSNTLCGICASRIPQLRSNIEPFEDHIQTIAFFVSAPYPNCTLYQSNTVGNNNRASFYGVQGSPTVHVNGVRVNIGSSIVPVSYLEDLIDDVTPLHINASMQINGATGVSDIEILFDNEVPQGPLVLNVYLVEKIVEEGPVNYGTHYNVYRANITPFEGYPLEHLEHGNTLTLNFDFPIEAGWQQEELAVVAFVQNSETKEVWNVTNSDKFVSNIHNPAPALKINMSPNPATDYIYLHGDLTLCEDANLTVRDMQGKLMITSTEIPTTGTGIQVSQLPSGTYLLQLQGRKCDWKQVFIIQ